MKTIKLLSFIIILLGSVMSGPVWALTRSGVGHTNGSDFLAVDVQLAGLGESQLSKGQPYASGIQIARRGGRGFRGGSRWYRGGRGFRGGNRWYRGGRGFRGGNRWYRGSRGFRGSRKGGFYNHRFYGPDFGGHYRYGPGIGYGTPYYSPYYYGW